MKKHILGLIGSFLFVPALAFAVPVAITWEWTLDDPNVTTFRYQIDGEDPDGWTVVDATQTTYTAQNLDGDKAYTLYLQQSYDGTNFSASATSTSEPLVVEKAAPVDEEASEPVPEPEASVQTPDSGEEAPLAVEPETSVAQSQEVATEPVVQPQETAAEAVVPAEPQPVSIARKERAPLRFGLGVYGSAKYNMDDDYKVLASSHSWKGTLGGQMRLENVVSGKVLGLGLDLKGAWEPEIDSKWEDVFKSSTGWDHWMDGSAELDIDVNLGRSLLTLGGGMYLTTDFDKVSYGIQASVGLGYHFTDHFYMGLEGQYRYSLDNQEKAQVLGGLASMMVTF